MANARVYDNLVDKDLEDAVADSEEESEEESAPEGSGLPIAALAQACLPFLICCCCCIFFFGFMGIGAAIFAPPEPREEPGDQIWSPVLPQNFSTCSRTFFWTSQEVHTPGSPCEEAGWFSSGNAEAALGTWEPGWSFFSLYYYYEKPDVNGALEAVIHVQSVPRFFGAEFRMWRGDTSLPADAPVLSIVQDYWAQPWFAWSKVRIFDVHQDSVHIARFTETVTPAWVGYGGATVDVRAPALGSSLATMTQPGVFWLFFFEPPPWNVQNLDPLRIPSAVPGFYSLFSDILEQQQATGPIFWIFFFCIICTNNSK